MKSDELSKGIRRLRRLLYADNPAMMTVDERMAESLVRVRIETLFGTRP